ncbi:MAG: hypothetical protein RI907_2776 [Pseudomonadota bacterium]
MITPVRRLALHAAALLACAPLAHAAEFNLYLKCKGEVQVGGKSKPATLDLAMRDNNQTALIQRSNVLPVGERLKYQVSKASYTMLYKLPLPGTHVYTDWVNGGWLVWQPNLKRLATIRIAVDRQSAELEGRLLDFNDESLGELAMQCEPSSNDDAPEPKF